MTEHDPDRPWIVVGTGWHVIELKAGENFFDWANRMWPAPRFSVELDPWQPDQPSG
jgi:hypothetical protein